jgi:hypothetical protein
MATLEARAPITEIMTAEAHACAHDWKANKTKKIMLRVTLVLYWISLDILTGITASCQTHRGYWPYHDGPKSPFSPVSHVPTVSVIATALYEYVFHVLQMSSNPFSLADAVEVSAWRARSPFNLTKLQAPMPYGLHARPKYRYSPPACVKSRVSA